MAKKTIFTITFLLRFFDIIGAISGDTIIINNPNDLTLIGNKIYFFEDKSSSLTISDILEPETQQKFTLHEKNIFTYSPSNSAYWFKFSLKNNTEDDIWLETGGSYSVWLADFYYQDSSGDWLSFVKKGALHPLDSKTYLPDFYRFNTVSSNKGGAKTYYVRIKSGVGPEIPFYIGTLNTLQNKNNLILVFTYVFIGMMSIMLLYNLFLFFATKDSIYFSYVLFVFFNTLCFTFNNNLSMLGSNPFWWEKHIAWQFLGDLFSVIFIIHLLDLKKTFPLSFKIYLAVVLLDFGIAILNLLGFETFVLINFYVLVSLLLVVNTLFTGVYLLIKKQKNAKIFMLSWSFFLLSLVVFMLVISGIIPYNIVTRYSVYLGISLETLFFSLALANRLNILKEEKASVLRENTELVQNHNIILEKEVLKKTKELFKENQLKDSLINEINHRVKNNLQTISSLIYFKLKSMEDDAGSNMLKDIRLKIDSMALIHELLYSKENLNNLSLKDFISSLMLNIEQLATSQVNNLQISFKFDDVNLNVNKFIALGMLTTEVITNSLKHAFINCNAPSIKLELKEENTYILYKIYDNGKGFNQDKIKKDKLGLRLIDIFSRQLDAETALNTKKGTCYTFKIPLG